MSIEDIQNKLIEYKKELNCKYPNSMFASENYEELNNKDKLTLQLFEWIIDYLEEEKAKQNGWYD